MIVLGIETTCDETAAAVVERSDGRPRQDPVQCHPVAGRRTRRLRRRGARDRRPRPCRGARPHHRRRPWREAGLRLRRHRRRRRRRRPRADRRRDRRADHGQGDRAGAAQAADRGQSSRGPRADRAADRRHAVSLSACSSPPAATRRSSRCAASATMCGSAPRIDDAIGEAFDKTAKLLGLGYPGGPQVEKEAARGNAARFALPRPMRGRPEADFSLSGLKTALRLEAEKIAPLSRPGRRRSVRLVPAGGGRTWSPTGCAPACGCSAPATARPPRWSSPAASPPTRRSARCCTASPSRPAPRWWCRRPNSAPTTAP